MSEPMAVDRRRLQRGNTAQAAPLQGFSRPGPGQSSVQLQVQTGDLQSAPCRARTSLEPAGCLRYIQVLAVGRMSVYFCRILLQLNAMARERH